MREEWIFWVLTQNFVLMYTVQPTNLTRSSIQYTQYTRPLTGASSRTGLHGGMCQCCRYVCCGLMRRYFCPARTPEKSPLHRPYHLLVFIRRLHCRVQGAFLVCFRKDCPCTLFVLSFFCLSDRKTLIYLCKWGVCLIVFPVILSKFSGCIA